MNRWIVVLAIAAAVLGGSAAAVRADSSAAVLPPSWHIHDGQAALGPQHKPVGFFPALLGISLEQYLQDPARCPNATDKAFLPSSGSAQSDLLRAGVCFTSTQVIHLRTVPLGTSGPDGWQARTAPTEPGWVTYYMVTPR